MPTTRRQAAHAPRDEPHQARHIAESFGTDAERYDRTRPGYPDALVRRITDASPDPAVLDVGCGTGIVARQFQAAGSTVLGVEPDARMAELARRRGTEVEISTFEQWEPAGRTFGAVVAGTAWHWVDPAAGAARAAAVLRAGGLLAVFGHVFELPPDLAAAFATAYRRAAPDSPIRLPPPAAKALDLYQAMYARAADGLRQTGAFAEPEQWRYGWEQVYTRAAWLDQLPTHGALTHLPADQTARVLDAVGAAIDARGGSFTLPYTTVALTAERHATGTADASAQGRPLSSGADRAAGV